MPTFKEGTVCFVLGALMGPKEGETFAEGTVCFVSGALTGPSEGEPL